MDRLNKNRPGKPGKPPHHSFAGSGELFALGKGNKANLGSGTTSTPESESRKPSSSSKVASSSSSVIKTASGGPLSSGSKSGSSERKRESGSSSSSSSHSNPTKKIRVQPNLGPGPNFLQPTPITTSSSKTAYSSQQPKPTKIRREHSTEDAAEIDPSDLSGEKFLAGLEKARKANDSDRAQALILAGLKRLRNGKEKPDATLCHGLLRGSKMFGSLLRTSSIFEVLCSLVTMKRSGVDAKTKLIVQNSSLFAPLAIAMISNSHDDVQTSWPLCFVQMWIDDACSERSWVENPQCKPFVDNLICSFNTKLPSSNLIPPSDQTGPPGGSSPSIVQSDYENIFQQDLEVILEENLELTTARPRYNGMEDDIETCILDYVREIINKKAPDVPRNVLKALASACGLTGIRSFIITRLEQWVHNAKCGKQAQELLLYICVNSHCNTTADSEIVLNIAKMRIKTKPLAHSYAIAIKEMVRDNEQNLKRVLNHLVHNELSPGKNTNNFALFSSIMTCSDAAATLAEIFLIILQKREDLLVGLRIMLREIVRSTRYEFDLVQFVHGLLKNTDSCWRDPDIRERGFKNIVDLINISMFLAVSPGVKEASVVRSDSKKDFGIVSVFQKLILRIQEDALVWLYSVVPNTFRPVKKEFLLALNKIILKDPANELQQKDGWPTDAEKSLFARLAIETPLGEESLMWMFFQAFTKEHNFTLHNEVMDLVELIIIRSATHSGILHLEKMEIFEFLFRLCAYKYPESINLPVGYEPPKLAISKLYWKVWIILSVIAAFCPATFGKVGWDGYPTLKILMEMCMTNHFSFPTVASSESADELLAKERQMTGIEREQILEFETHLAAASSKNTITERSSLLLPQLMRMEPLGNPRTPPPEVLSLLQSYNDQLRLGHRLCKSRSPDFLVDQIQRNSQPMPWLSELVSEGSFEILPVQCLCEFMLGQTERIVKTMNQPDMKTGDGENPGEKVHKKGTKGTPELIKEDVKGLQLLHYLKDVVHGSQDDLAREVLDYFFRRLAFKKMLSRVQALQGIQLLMSSPKKPLDENWLLDSIPTLRLFTEMLPSITLYLRNAIQVENEPKWISQYLEFLSTWSNMVVDVTRADGEGLALDVAQLVVERNGVINSLLECKPKAYESLFLIYLNHILKVREPPQTQEQRDWSGSVEQVLVQWPVQRLEASLHISIIHAIVLLLSSYATIQGSKQKKKSTAKEHSGIESKYNDLLDIWFPKDPANLPKGFMLSSGKLEEEAILYPDWIKLRMIRSNNERLLDAASRGLNINQLMLFVQSFGVPVTAMTAMLFIVDTLVEKDPENVSLAVVDAQYMNTLVELQWKRGASGGEKFSQLLKTMIGGKNLQQPVLKVKIPKFRARPQLPESLLSGVEKMDITTEDSTALKPYKSSKNSTGRINRMEIDEHVVADEDQNIRSLSKKLLTAASSASSSFRRRSSLPLLDDNVSLTPRRHSSYYEQLGEKKGSFPANTVGQLVDKIRDIEPCIVRNALDIQLPLLFGRNEAPPACRSFLLTVLTHESGWDTVEQCLQLFLKEFDPSYDPSTILDLISSTIKNPKLWQGCDKYVPKHQPLQSVFHLTQPQLLVMAEYIVEEISQLEVKNTKFSISNLLGPSQSSQPRNGKKTKHCLQQRVWQWLLCCDNRKELVDDVIRSLITKKGRNPCTKKLISQVYLEFPEVILMKNWKDASEEIVGSDDDVSCILDAVSHTLITAAADVKSGKEWYKKVTNECEICLRKIASVHPVLLLRQLPLMGALLEGRVHLESAVFHAENHQVPFQIYLGLIDLMQPHVLKHFKILKNIFTLYIKLFKNFGHQRDYSSTLGRFSVLLHNSLSTNPIEMKEFLTEHHSALKELVPVKYYADVAPFQNLMTSIVPPSAGSELALLTSSETDPFNMSSGTTTAIFERMQTSNNHDEVVPVLQELDSLSNRNPAVLHKFSEILIPLVLSENDHCRTLAFTLILKHVTYSPSVNTLYLDIILQALQTSSSHLKDILLDRIHEFVVLSQENAVVVLKQMFELGISSNVNILPAISKSLGLLRNQTGSS